MTKSKHIRTLPTTPLPQKPGIMSAKRKAKFWSRVNKNAPNGCWEWTGGRDHNDYGAFWLDGLMQKTHRLAYGMLVGPVPTDKYIDHLCRNHPCVNPGHLEPVSVRENTLRGQGISAQRAKQTHCFRGHPLSGDNLILKDNHRRCLACRKINDLRRYHKRQAALKSNPLP